MSFIRGENDIKRPGDTYIRREPVNYKYIRGQEDQQEEIYIGKHEQKIGDEDIELTEDSTKRKAR